MYTRENRSSLIICLNIFLRYPEGIYYRKPQGIKLLHSTAQEAFALTIGDDQPKKPAVGPDL